MMTEREQALDRVIQTAAGKRPAETVIAGARVVDVLLGRVTEPVMIGLCDDKIAYIGPDRKGLIGPETKLRDQSGRVVIPGLIDGHTHLDSMWTTAAFVETALPYGNTTCITEVAMVAAAMGPAGVEAYCADAAGLPMRIYFTAPSLVPPFPALETSAGFDNDAFDEFIKRPDCLGLGETYWPPALSGDERPLHRFDVCRELNKTIEGHAAGARGDRLTAYRAGGVLTCHESVSLQDARDRLAVGLAVQIREGFIRREMEAVLPGLTEAELDSGLVMLTTDVGDPVELVEGRGGMNLLLKKAVGLGVDPVRAVRLATLYPARHFHLRWLGAISPGNLADMVIVDDLTDFNVRQVWVGGQLTAEEGRTVVPCQGGGFPDWMRRSIALGPITADDFRLTVKPGRCRVRAVEAAGETVTKERLVDLDAPDGLIKADPGRDLLKLAHFDRRGGRPPALGLVTGTGLGRGAVAMSLIWDTNNVLALGADEADMARAVNRLVDLGGGLVVWADGRVKAELPMPIGGIIAELSLAELMATADGVEAALRELGWGEKRPFLTLQTLAFTGLPFLRLTDRGLADIRAGKMVEVIVSEGR